MSTPIVKKNGKNSQLSVGETLNVSTIRPLSGDADVGSSADLVLTGRGQSITINEAGNTTLNPGLTATSVVGAINEVYNNLPASNVLYVPTAAEFTMNVISSTTLPATTSIYDVTDDFDGEGVEVELTGVDAQTTDPLIITWSLNTYALPARFTVELTINEEALPTFPGSPILGFAIHSDDHSGFSFWRTVHNGGGASATQISGSYAGNFGMAEADPELSDFEKTVIRSVDINIPRPLPASAVIPKVRFDMTEWGTIPSPSAGSKSEVHRKRIDNSNILSIASPADWSAKTFNRFCIFFMYTDAAFNLGSYTFSAMDIKILRHPLDRV
jgi:hypothetical protein